MFTLIRTLLPIALFLLSLAVALWNEARAQAPALQAAPGMPSRAEIDRATAAAARAIPNLPPMATDPASQPPLDLSNLARDYDVMRGQRSPAAAEGADPSDRQTQGLIVFVSLGMPRASLERLIADAQKTRSALVLRGMLDGSLQKTKARIQELVGDRKVGWQIDPTLFDRFKVSGVPTFVLIDPARPVSGDCGTTLCQQPSYSKVAGDVTTAFALADMSRRDPEFAVLARRFAANLGGLR